MIGKIRGSGGTIDDLRYDVSPTAAIVDLMSKWEVDPPRSFFVQSEKHGRGLMKEAGIPVHFFPGGDLHAFVSRRLDRSADLRTRTITVAVKHLRERRLFGGYRSQECRPGISVSGTLASKPSS